MKLSLKISTIFLLFLFCFSCKDDETEPTASIVGKWKGDRSEIHVTYGLIPVYEETDDDFNVTLEFKEDGTVSFLKDGNETTGTWDINGTKLTTNVDFQIDEIDLSTVTFDVIKLSQERLELHLEKDQDVDVPDYGMITATVKADLEFDRL
jgi:hypothetical protein